jgi:hypothetical protein
MAVNNSPSSVASDEVERSDILAALGSRARLCFGNMRLKLALRHCVVLPIKETELVDELTVKIRRFRFLIMHPKS